MENIDLKSLKVRISEDIKSVKDLKDSNDIFKKYLGKKGELVCFFRSLALFSKEERIKISKEANEIKNNLVKELEEKKKEFQGESCKNQGEQKIDITIPGKKTFLGSLHPLTQTTKKIQEIFQSMGFEVVEGPEVENEWYNFDALNIPKDHPARDSWDTFWLKTEFPKETMAKTKTKLPLSNGLLLRTHTSPVQIRFMEKNNPPFKIITFGNVFRHEASDVSHEIQFSHFEGLMVGKEISVANLKAVVGEFFKRFFEKEINFRLRPDFFPFTEPSFDISINCLMCGGKGCSVCKKTGWLEVAGAGMVHPNVFKNSGLIAKDWQGWAFGFGLERLAMLKYKINDIRIFRLNDLRFLRQF